jgi:hypothetical protein
MSNEIPRRNFLSRSLFALAAAMAAPSVSFSESFKKAFQSNNSVMNPILSTKLKSVSTPSTRIILF